LEVGWGAVDWIGLAQDRNRWRALVNSVLNLGSMKCWETIRLILIIGLCILLHVYQLNIGRPPYATLEDGRKTGPKHVV
jgi:hypothetical protein